jgi:hypothetical protein
VGTVTVLVGGLARMLLCSTPVKPPIMFVVYSIEKYSPVALCQRRSTNPGALRSRFKDKPTLRPNPLTLTGPHRSLVVLSPHWPWSFAPYCQTEPSDLTAILCQSLAATFITLLNPAP